MNHGSTGNCRQREPLAIVGMGCRFPGGVIDVESFWRLLAERRSGIVEVPETRWNREHYYHPDGNVANKMVTKWGGFVDGIENFDARFWGISPREAARMDPQQRWLLETAWEAIEDSATAPGKLRGSPTGVFVGIASHDFASIQMSENVTADVHTNTGSALSIAANRISYLLDLKGTSVAIDTACSSALVALALACDSIRTGRCEAALAGGVNALITPHTTIGFSRASMLSPSGQCYAFDARADGYVRGEGAGMVYIKRLRDAMADGDRIYAVIRSAVTNQDGHTSSMTVPGIEGQAAMLQRAYAEAGIPAGRVVYMEAHGTGTPVGDPVEAAALASVLSQGRPAHEPCVIGSVKTNIGHLEAGSGVAGLIKAALVLYKDRIPPNRNFELPNPGIPFETYGLRVATTLEPLPHHHGATPVVGVNSFGFGGTNAHVVLEAAPEEAAAGDGGKKTCPAQRPFVLPVSARDETALKNYAHAFYDLLADETRPLADVCYSAGARKEQHPLRVVFLGDSHKTLRRSITHWLETPEKAVDVISGRAVTQARRPVFIFTGQGAQWWAMGQQLLDREPIFRQMIGQVDTLLQPLAGWSLIQEMQRPEASSRMHLTAIAQPAIFALQIALVGLWRAWGVFPSKMVGHSVGEVAAAYCAGIYSLQDAVRIIFHRSRLQETTAGKGRMLAVGLSAPEAQAMIGHRAGQIQVAAINSASFVTLAGEEKPLKTLADTLAKDGRFYRWLRVNYAFHTHQMEPIKEELIRVLGGIRPRPSRIPFVSTVSAGVMAGETLDSRYWWQNVRDTVQFGPAIESLVAGGATLFLEIGPHPALKSSLNQCLHGMRKNGALFHSLNRDSDESVAMLTNLAGLHCHGVSIDWAAVNQTAGHPVRLPHYPWHHERYWLDKNETRLSWLLPDAHPLLGRRIPAPNPTWEFILDPNVFGYLKDHRVWDSMVFPGAGYGEIGIALAKELFPDTPCTIENIDIRHALFIPADTPPVVRVIFEHTDKSYGVYSAVGNRENWTCHAQGHLAVAGLAEPVITDLPALRRNLNDPVDRDHYYAEFAAAGYQFGEGFQQIQQVWRASGQALAQIIVPTHIAETIDRYHFHPAILDACFQVFKGLQHIPHDAIAKNYCYLPTFIRQLRIHCDRPPASLWAHARLIDDAGASPGADIIVCDDSGRRMVDIRGFRTEHVKPKPSADDIENGLYQFRWEQMDLPEPADEGLPSNHLPTVQFVFADQSGLGAALCRLLAANGHRAVCIKAGATYQPAGPDELTIRPDVPDDLQRVLADAAIPADRPIRLVHCWSLDHPSAEYLTSDGLLAAQMTGPLHALRLVHLLAGLDRATPPRVWFVTRGVHPVAAEDTCARIASAPIVGFARVANTEHPAFRWTVVDLEAGPDDADAQTLLREILREDDELEVAYRQRARYANRLTRVAAEDLPLLKTNALHSDGNKTPYRLQFDTPGILTNLRLHETRRRDPGPDEIEVEVSSGGINFRDVMKALGMYPGNPVDVSWLGDDVAGTVVNIGADVKAFQPGDEVIGMAPYAFRAFTTMGRRMCFQKPAHLSLAEAATVPTAFLTAMYAIRHLARMKAGESILIHAGTGGVGQAAIQVARHLGVTILATAGTPEKRKLLRDMGIQTVMNSRSLDFADEVMAATGGRGVDAVLNSLAGDYLHKSLSVLAPFGRFLEIGKMDVYGNTQIGLALLRHNISCFVIDLAQLAVHQPAVMASLFTEMAALFTARAYQPLPFQCFPITEATEAFRFMAQGRHVGKIVLSFDAKEIPISPCSQSEHLFREQASYLIVGGNGGVGLEIAKWMARHGARHLVLLSRSGPRDRAAAVDIEQLCGAGINVVETRADATRLTDLCRVIDEIKAQLPPLRGVVHGAMVLDDDFLLKLDDARFCAALHPKLLGAWHLHVATMDEPLEHFICLSSFSNMVGGARQANYNAGNAFLDALAHYRHSLGLPALTYNWTAFSDAGAVARDPDTARYLDQIGMKPIGLNEAFHLMGRILMRDPVQLGVCRADWTALARFSPLIGLSKTFSGIRGNPRDRATSGGIGLQLQSAEPQHRPAVLETFIREQLAEVLNIKAIDVPRDIPLTTLGLDSLMGIELMNRIERELGVTLAMGHVLGGSTVMDFAGVLLKLVLEGSRTATPREENDANGVATPVTGSRLVSIPVDFRLDARLDPSIMPPADTRVEIAPPRRILLTGATGFVGAFLLDELLRRTDAQIYCLVRAADGGQAADRLADNLRRYDLAVPDPATRVIAVPGDFSKPFMGLSPAQYDELAQQTDTIYHNGADVNLGASYLALRQTNVMGTREILRLAARCRLKPTHFVSTFTVMATEKTRGRIVRETDPLPAPETLLHGYAQTKWVSEKLVHEAQLRGIPISIYRPGHVTGHSQSGVSNLGDLLHTVLMTCWQMGTAPEHSGALDMTPVDYVSKAIAAISLRADCLGGTYHLVNPKPLEYRVLAEWMQRVNSGIRTVSYDQWRKELLALSASTRSRSVRRLLEMIVPDAAGNGGDTPPALHPQYDCRQVLHALADTDIRCADMNDHLLGVYLSYARRSGAFRGKTRLSD